MWIETCTDKHCAYFSIQVPYIIDFGFMVTKELKIHRNTEFLYQYSQN